MSQSIFNQFIAKCRQINRSFRTDEGGGLLQKKSSLYGLLEFLRRQIQSDKIKIFNGAKDAVSHCENPNDPRIAKYLPAINWLVNNWGKDEPDASGTLVFLRKNPKTATAKAAFAVTEVNSDIGTMGGRCNIECKGRPPVFSLRVSSGGGDWYIPYAHASAKSVLVPFGQPEGTMVVTFPMNGCAFEVRQEQLGNRFYHDADGKNMPNLTTDTVKFRADYRTYGGVHDLVAQTFQNMRDNMDTTNTIPGQFHFDIIAVKKGSVWHVCQSASMALVFGDTANSAGSFVFKNEIEHYLGSFPDKE